MFERLRPRIELVSNAAIIAVAVVVCYVLIRDHSGAYATQSSGNAVVVVSAGKPAPSVPGIRWSDSERTMLFVVSSRCKFCRESEAFYRKLLARKNGTSALRMVAVVPRDEEGRTYLRSAGLNFEEVRQADPQTLGVKGTPTLVLVNRNGRVLGTWSGKLPIEGEQKVLDAIQ